jgi:PhnB protein
MYIPEGYGTVFPYMIVDEADKFVDFLKKVFNATETGRTTLPNGRVANLRMTIGTSRFMVTEAMGENMKAMPAAYYVYVEDVDRTLANAVSNGAVKIFDPMDMPYLDRQGGVIDPCGNIWWISRRLVEASYDD